MLGVARKVRRGDFHRKVRVVSNDELGIMGDGMNAMMGGLIERERLRRGLYLAQEIQQALLPQKCPNIDGLDIAARSLYCDETGGDYFDFIGNDGKQLNVVIGDVSGHGISSAILMASVRAFLRQRVHLPGRLSLVLADVNRQLVTDVDDSGSFMTLFYLRLDPEKRSASWVRAGHDPALLYDPGSDRFDEMKGKGQALGISEQARFEENQKTGLRVGQVIVLATDGLWEARNRKGAMFGKAALCEIIRQNNGAPAETILKECFQSLEKFQSGAVREDDITMVVIKMVGMN
jgi:sigma-B regulation protein RsbU (phosphoserine phosphatase)